MPRPMFPRSLYWVMHPDHSVEPEPDLKAWGRWMAKADRRVAQHWWVIEVDGVRAGIRVSTVFLGIDHNHAGRGPALLFESMIFGGPHAGDMRRYVTWDQALKGHGEMVERERSWLGDVGKQDIGGWVAGLRRDDPVAGVPGAALARVVAAGSGDAADDAAGSGA